MSVEVQVADHTSRRALNFHFNGDVVAIDDAHDLHFNTTIFTRFLYLFTVAVTGLVSDIFIFSQGVRTAPTKDWTRNGNVIVIGAAYVLIIRSLHIDCVQGCLCTTWDSSSSASNVGCRCT